MIIHTGTKYKWRHVSLIHHTPMFEFCMKFLELEYQSPLPFWGQEGKNQTKTICERKKKKKNHGLRN